jgi:radical SAM protein with 4Fe4S-binding SPASM domain
MEEIGVWQLDLTGGEATLHPDFEKIVEKLKNSFIFVTLFTNLAYKSKKTLEKIIKLKPKLVVTSIDGSCPKVHDSFRGKKGAWKNTINNIRYLKNKGLLVRVNVIISNNNARDLPKIIDLLKNDLQVDYVLGDVFCFPGCANLKLPNKIIIESIYKYRKKIYLRRANQKENRKRIIPPCGVGFNFLFINSKGETSLCPTLTREEKIDFCAGNIYKNKSIKKIWEESEVFKKYRFMQCKKIKSCKCVNYCKGGCRSRAFFEKGNVFGIDPINCGVAKKIYEKNKN